MARTTRQPRSRARKSSARCSAARWTSTGSSPAGPGATLSLHQELTFIEKIEQLLEDGQLSQGHKYKQIVVRVIELSRTRLPRSMGSASKLNRDPHFIQRLMAHGEQQAEEFLAARASNEPG